MHEDLDLDVGAAPDLRDVLERKLAREDHARRADLPRKLDRRSIGAGHLCRRVDGEIGRDRAREPRHAEVLHDHRVDAGLGAGPHRGLDARELGVEDERVERHVPARAVLVQPAHGLAELGRVEVRRASSSVEALEPEIHGIRARVDRGLERLAISSGRKELGLQGRRACHWAPSLAELQIKSSSLTERGVQTC